MIELSRCPRCGGNPIYRSGGTGGLAWLHCDADVTCRFTGPMRHSENAAKEGWNEACEEITLAKQVMHHVMPDEEIAGSFGRWTEDQGGPSYIRVWLKDKPAARTQGSVLAELREILSGEGDTFIVDSVGQELIAQIDEVTQAEEQSND